MAKKEMMWHTSKGIGMLVLGILILINVYWPYLSWGAFVGAVFAIIGFLKLVIPYK